MGNKRLNIARVLIASALIALTACENKAPEHLGPEYGSRQDEGGKQMYRLAIHPLHNPTKLVETYHPLVDYLNEHFNDIHFELEASRDYQAYEAKFRANEPELILPNPWQTLEAIKVGYRVIAMAGDAEDFKGIFIVRKDSNIENITDLKGKIVSYPSATALAACIMPQYYLHTHGIDVNHDIENIFVGSQESAIMNTYLQQSDVGVTWPPPWRLFQQDHPNEAAELTLIWETPPLMNNSVMARHDIPEEISTRIQILLTQLHTSQTGQQILHQMSTSRFHTADNNAYQPVADFIERFEQEVRPVEQE